MLTEAVKDGGEHDYYSKPLNEFKNSYFSAFAIQSPRLGLMQKTPFAFLLRVEPSRALARWSMPRITGAANLCVRLQNYHSWSPVRGSNVCNWAPPPPIPPIQLPERNSARRIRLTVWRTSAAAVYRAAGCDGLMPPLSPPAVLTLPSEAAACFHDATCVAAGRFSIAGVCSKLQNRHKP